MNERKPEKKKTKRKRVNKGGEKGWGESKVDTEQTSRKAVSGGKQIFFSLEKKKETTKNTNKTNKNLEGLGPSEVALRATSPDP